MERKLQVKKRKKQQKNEDDDDDDGDDELEQHQAMAINSEASSLTSFCLPRTLVSLALWDGMGDW